MVAERFTGLAAVLDAIRSEDGVTQPALVERVALGRSVVAQRVAELEAAGLVTSDGWGPSTGGRAPRRLRLRAEGRYVLGVDLASHELVVALADLAGVIRATDQRHIDATDGPDVVLAAAESMIAKLVDDQGARGKLWAVALGMPEPVAFDSTKPVALPTMPAWEHRHFSDRLSTVCSAPLWMDDRVNLLALGERRVNPRAARSEHMLYVGGGATIGAAAVVSNRLYRGSLGLAGAIGHLSAADAGVAEICRCGNTGCLDTVVGGAALVRDARLLAELGRSPALADVLAGSGAIRPLDITQAAEAGDAAARALLHRSGSVIGKSLAAVVNIMNPDLVVIGGGLARARGYVLEPIRAAIHAHAWPVVTQSLSIELSSVDEAIAGVTGAVQFALDQLLAPEHLPDLLSALLDG